MTKRKKRYILKIFGWFILIIFLLIVAAGTLVYFKGESYINKNLSEIVSKKSKGLYLLDFDRIDFSINPLSVSVYSVSLKYDDKISEKILEKEPDKVFYSFRSPRLTVSEINLTELINLKLFHCKRIAIEKPEFSLSGKGFLQKNSTEHIDKAFRELKPLFAKYIKEIKVDRIDFIDANYKLYSSAARANQISNAHKIVIGIKKFRTDSAMIFSRKPFFDSEDIVVNMNHFRNELGDSLHVLTIDTLEYSLRTTDIYASGIDLFYKQKTSKKNLYKVSMPSLKIRSKSLSSFSVNDTLQIEYLKLEQPEISFFQKEILKKVSIEDISNFNLYSLVESQFKEVKIDSFVISQAKLKIFRQPETDSCQQKFGSLTIELNNFELNKNSAKKVNKIFYADDIDMTVNGYSLKLEDNRHRFSADSMFVSTQSNILGIKNIRITPFGNETKKRRTAVNVDCSALLINNVDLKKVFHTRTVPTKNIKIENPYVVIKYYSAIEKVTRKNDRGLLFELVTAYLKGVYSEIVEVDNGYLKIQTIDSRDKTQSYFETGFNFNLSGFALDSASVKQTDKFFYADNFDIRFNGYSMKLEDKLHKIDVKEVLIHSFDYKLEIKDLRMKPVVKNAGEKIMRRYNRSELFDIYVPEITMWGVNLRDAFFFNKLNIRKFQVVNPKIYFENFGMLRQQKEKKNISDIYSLVFDYIYDFDIKEVSIPDGNFTWINHTKKGKTTSFDNEFSATLYNFRLNEKELTKKRLLFSDNFEISVKNQIFQLSDSVHILRAGEIVLSGKESKIRIKNGQLYPLVSSPGYKKLKTTYQVNIPELSVTGFDFSKAYYSRNPELKTLMLSSPSINIYRQAGSSKSLDFSKFNIPLPAFVTSLKLGEFKIDKGEVTTFSVEGGRRNKESSFVVDLLLPTVSMKNTENDKLKVSTGNFVAKIYDFKTPLGKWHKLNIGELDFDKSAKTIGIRNLVVKPFVKKRTDNRFSISVPAMHFSGFDINDALNLNYYSFDKIKISDPVISIGINDTIKGDKLEFAKNLDLYPFVESYVDKISVGELNFSNVNLDLKLYDKKLVDKKFNLRLNKINIGENIKSGNLLNSEEFEISTTNLQTVSKNGLYSFIADSMIYNSAKHSALLKNIEVIPQLSADEFNKKNYFQKDYVTLKTEYIELRNIDEGKWLEDKILDAGALVVGGTTIDIFRDKRLPFDTGQRPPWPQDLLRKIEQPFVFDSVILKPSTLKYSELSGLSDKRGFIEFNNLTVRSSRVSNIPAVISSDRVLTMQASAKMYNSGLMSLNFKFDLTPGNYRHSVSGGVSRMPLTLLNNIVQSSAPLSIESGNLTRFDFDFDFGETSSSGLLFMGYDNLKITVYNKKSGGAKKSKFASFWANKIINTENPKKGGELVPVKINYMRDEKRAVINYWWKSIFTGAKDVLGIKRKNSRKK